MKKLFTTLGLVLFCSSVMAQGTTLLDKVNKRIESDKDITVTGSTRIMAFGETTELETAIMISGDRFRFDSDDMTVWFDGKTMWRSTGPADDAEEITVTIPETSDIALLNPVIFLKNHDGFKVSQSGSVITFTAEKETYAGIGKMTFHVDSATQHPDKITIIAGAEGRNATEIVFTITSYKTKCNLDRSLFTCPESDYQDIEIIDLR